jgi:hypothetical protein
MPEQFLPETMKTSPLYTTLLWPLAGITPGFSSSDSTTIRGTI